MSQQLTSKFIIDEGQRLRQESRQLRHKCRNTRGVSVLWMELSGDLLKAVLTNQSRRVKNRTKAAEGDTQDVSQVEMSEVVC